MPPWVERIKLKISNFEEMQRDFANGTFDLTENGKCTGCGGCCSNLLPMTDEEIRIISKYIKSHGIKEQKRLLPTVNPNIDMTCPFLDNSKKCDKCTIYEVRPRICREFICDPKKRKPLDLEFIKRNPVIRNVRQVFFGKE